MGKKRWATEVNDEQFDWLKGIAAEVQRNLPDQKEDYTGSMVIQEMIEELRAKDRVKLIKQLVQNHLQRKLEALQTQLDTLTQQTKGGKAKKGEEAGMRAGDGG